MTAVQHAVAGIDRQMAAQIGFFFESFHEQFIGSAKEFPIDKAGRFAGSVMPMFGKFDRKSMKGGTVAPG
jgi:hypothetical protein